MRDVRISNVDDAERATGYDCPGGECCYCLAEWFEPHEDDCRYAPDESRGLWIGAVLVAGVAVAALVVGWWARGAWG